MSFLLNSILVFFKFNFNIIFLLFPRLIPHFLSVCSLCGASLLVSARVSSVVIIIIITVNMCLLVCCFLKIPLDIFTFMFRQLRTNTCRGTGRPSRQLHVPSMLSCRHHACVTHGHSSHRFGTFFFFSADCLSGLPKFRV
jgi:hypothetical protein